MSNGTINRRATLSRRRVLANALNVTLAAPMAWMACSSATAAPPPANKAISLIVRKTGISREEFNQHWLGEHGPTARQVPGIRGFLLGEVVDDPRKPAGNAAASELDGIAMSWQDPAVDRATQAREFPGVQQWLSATAQYMGQIRIFGVKEHVFVPPQRGGIRIVSLLTRKSDVAHEDFVRHVLEIHGPLSRRVPGLKGYVISEIVREATHPSIPPLTTLGEIDCIGEGWLGGADGQQTPSSPQLKEWLADGAANFGRVKTFATVDHVFVPPPV